MSPTQEDHDYADALSTNNLVADTTLNEPVAAAKTEVAAATADPADAASLVDESSRLLDGDALFVGASAFDAITASCAAATGTAQRLRVLGDARRHLEDVRRAVEAEVSTQVQIAFEEGLSQARIGAHLGRSAQAIGQRYALKEDKAESPKQDGGGASKDGPDKGKGKRKPRDYEIKLFGHTVGEIVSKR